ncbi:hypothetical protein [Puerhibacterium puerhi]|uniref:hypothetical protein n=1 Tax=Puerhibacterium puerhi TaxID=2692623 RepID=UPI00135793ED|nr:hypothetical protein [Puerhibacterium puerhi]
MHPEMVCALAQADHRERLAEAENARLVRRLARERRVGLPVRPRRGLRWPQYRPAILVGWRAL